MLSTSSSPTVLESWAQYQRLRNLDPLLADKVFVVPFAGGCWIWTGTKTTDGYGQVRRTDCGYGRTMRVAHRRVYRLLVDPELPEMPGCGSALTLDHLCRVRSCCNPAHLAVVTRRQNVIVGSSSLLGETASEFVGVAWHTTKRKWRTSIWVAGKQRHLGLHTDETEAAHTYDAACILLGISTGNVSRGLCGPPGEQHYADARRHLTRHGLLDASRQAVTT